MRSVLVVLICLATLGDGRACTIPFGNLPVEQTPDEYGALAESTFLKLLESAASKELSIDQLRRLAEGADPFALPEGGELATLRRHVAEFRRVLELRGWNTPALRARLLGTVKARARQLADLADGRSGTIEREQRRQIEISDPEPFYLTEMPDGKGLVMQSRISAQPGKYPVHHIDAHTGRRTPWGLSPYSDSEHFRVTPDGKAIVYLHSYGTITVVPRTEAGPDWNRAAQVGENDSQITRQVDPELSVGPDRVVARMSKCT